MERFGRYTLLEELSESYLGPRWLAQPAGAGETTPHVVVRCIAANDEHDARERMAAAAAWAMGVTLGTGPAATDVVQEGSRLGMVGPFHAGETLRMLLARDARRGIHAEAGVALRIVVDLLNDVVRVEQAAARDLAGASYAYGGVVPDSVLVGTDGRTQLLDVGVGAVASALPPWNQRPEHLAYDVPERCGSYASIDASANVFAVGILLWELVAGRRLFSGATRDEVAGALLNDAIPRLDEVVTDGSVAAGVASLVACALERDPERRIADAAALLRAIDGLDTPLASHDEVADFVKGGADRMSRAVGRLSERPPSLMPLPPPPVGVLLIPDWVKAAMDGSDAPPSAAAALPSRDEPKTTAAVVPALPPATVKEPAPSSERPRSRPPGAVRVAIAVAAVIGLIVAASLAWPDNDEPDAPTASSAAPPAAAAPPVSVAPPAPSAPPAPVAPPPTPVPPPAAEAQTEPVERAAPPMPRAPAPAPEPVAAPALAAPRPQAQVRPVPSAEKPALTAKPAPAPDARAKPRAKRTPKAKAVFVPDGI